MLCVQDGAAYGYCGVKCSRSLNVLFVCSVFSHSLTISFIRDDLLDIRQHTPDNFFQFFVDSDVLLDVLVRGAAVLVKRALGRKRGKRAGVLVKLRERGFQTALPSIHLANLQSLPNKADKLLLLTRANKDFSNSAALCFTKTWLSEIIPDNALHLLDYQLFRADRITELTGKRWWSMWRLAFRHNNSEEDVHS